MIIGCNYGSSIYIEKAKQQAEQTPFEVITEIACSRGTKGDNWWRWKPSLILNVMDACKEGTFILYMDAGDRHTPEFFTWLNAYTATNDTLFVTQGYIHQEWTKGDCFEAMGMLHLMSAISPQLEAGLIGLRNNDSNRALVEEWAKWMEDDQIVTDTPSNYPNHVNFIEHRHDQSILTNLVLRDKYPIHTVHGIIWNAR
jgi:hypothetical protein